MYPNVSPEQKRRFWRALDFYINSIQEAFALYESGSLDREIYEPSLAGLAAHLVTPGGSAFWNEHRDFLPSHFKEAVEQRMARGSLPDILEHPYFQIVEPETTAAQQDTAADSASAGA